MKNFKAYVCHYLALMLLAAPLGAHADEDPHAKHLSLIHISEPTRPTT